MEALTMGTRNTVEDNWVELIASVFREAAWDYRRAVRWLTRHPTKFKTKEYAAHEQARDEIVEFTRSPLFGLAIPMKPEVFLKMALNGQIMKNGRV